MSSDLNRDDVSAFTAAAREFIDWVDRGRVADLSGLHSLLARLQAAAAALPDVSSEEEAAEPRDDRPAYADVVRRLAGLPLDGYAVTFNALEEPPEGVRASLADDLADIYLDLLDGFRYFDAAQVREAVWQWRFGYYSHWGRHAIHAQTALWQYLADGSVD